MSVRAFHRNSQLVVLAPFQNPTLDGREPLSRCDHYRARYQGARNTMSVATLETRINAGQPVLICSRCGWWAYWAKWDQGQKIDLDAFNCPDCKSPLDSVEPRS